MEPMTAKRRAQLMAGPYTKLLIQHETALEDIYVLFAGTIPGQSDFWKAIAREEREHTELVGELDRRMKAGEFGFTKPAYVCGKIMESIDWVAVVRERVERQGVSMRGALQLALGFEQTAIEARFFEILDQDSDATKRVFEALQEATVRHAERIRKEASSLKWKVLGRRVHAAPSSGKAAPTREEIREKVRASQAAVIDLMILLEESAAKLYGAYGGKIESASGFWHLMAAEEMHHAAMLRNLHAILEQGKLFVNIGRFDKGSIRAHIEFIRSAEADAHRDELSRRKALNTAVQVENSMMERGFYETAESDAPEFKFIARRLADHTRTHIARLTAELGKA